jgi:hypothetical protein
MRQWSTGLAFVCVLIAASANLEGRFLSYHKTANDILTACRQNSLDLNQCNERLRPLNLGLALNEEGETEDVADGWSPPFRKMDSRTRSWRAWVYFDKRTGKIIRHELKIVPGRGEWW